MRIDDFAASLAGATPPEGLDLARQGLWWAGKGAGQDNWARAHGCVQRNEGDPACDWVHAHLHRREGDLGNARYWYHRAGRPVASGPLDQEWAALARALLES